MSMDPQMMQSMLSQGLTQGGGQPPEGAAQLMQKIMLVKALQGQHPGAPPVQPPALPTPMMPPQVPSQ